jgi:hypothetical protein
MIHIAPIHMTGAMSLPEENQPAGVNISGIQMTQMLIFVRKT